MKNSILHRKISVRKKGMKNKPIRIFFLHKRWPQYIKKLYKKITYHQIECFKDQQYKYTSIFVVKTTLISNLGNSLQYLTTFWCPKQSGLKFN